MSFDKAFAEVVHRQRMNEIAHEAFLQLRDTLSPTFDAKSLGYESADHARLTIVRLTARMIDKACSEHLRKHG